MRDNEYYLGESFPKLVYSESVLVDNTRERLCIDDVSNKIPGRAREIQELLELLVLSSRGTLNLFDAQSLSATLNRQLESLLTNQNPEETLVIFPGAGSQPVKDLIETGILKPFPCLELQTQRLLGPDKRVQKVDILTGKTIVRRYLTKKITMCALIDDVLVSGLTAQSIRDYIDPKGKLRWIAMTWMSLSPLQSSTRQLASSGLPNFEWLFTSILYQGLRGIPVNNSLSTLIGTGEKSRAILEKYRENFVENTEVFDKTIESLRRLIYE